MKPKEERNPARRRLLGTLAGAVTGLVGLKLVGQRAAAAGTSPQVATLEAAAAGPAEEPSGASRAIPLIKPAPHSVKRHG